jgi:hypothetical protein
MSLKWHHIVGGLFTLAYWLRRDAPESLRSCVAPTAHSLYCWPVLHWVGTPLSSFAEWGCIISFPLWRLWINAVEVLCGLKCSRQLGKISRGITSGLFSRTCLSLSEAAWLVSQQQWATLLWLHSSVATGTDRFLQFCDEMHVAENLPFYLLLSVWGPKSCSLTLLCSVATVHLAKLKHRPPSPGSPHSTSCPYEFDYSVQLVSVEELTASVLLQPVMSLSLMSSRVIHLCYAIGVSEFPFFLRLISHCMDRQYLLLKFLFIWMGLGLELRAYTVSHSTSPFFAMVFFFFKIGL